MTGFFTILENETGASFPSQSNLAYHFSDLLFMWLPYFSNSVS